MLSMNTGALEAHLALDASSDSVMTPDFRILLAGPGEFHYRHQRRQSRTTPACAHCPATRRRPIVSELLGDRTYQVKATDQLVFRAGQLDRVDMAVPIECGCPPSAGQLRCCATNDLAAQRKAESVMPPVNAGTAVAETTIAGECSRDAGDGRST